MRRAGIAVKTLKRFFDHKKKFVQIAVTVMQIYANDVILAFINVVDNYIFSIGPAGATFF